MTTVASSGGMFLNIFECCATAAVANAATDVTIGAFMRVQMTIQIQMNVGNRVDCKASSQSYRCTGLELLLAPDYQFVNLIYRGGGGDATLGEFKVSRMVLMVVEGV